VRDGDSYEVVGVARSVKYLTLGEEPTPYIYRPLAQTGASTMTLIVRTAADPTGLIRELRPAVRVVDDRVAVYNVETMTDRMRLAYLPATSGAAVLTLLGIVALMLTAVGLYGTVDYAAGRRTHEIGVRRALGAQQAAIVWLVVRRVALFAAAGLAVGAGAGLIGSRALRTLLYDVDPFDHLVAALASVVMVGVCTIAAGVPAWRAAHIDPAVALRRE
jgi:ABC-type antimicrobial peptide transport system permease subunit